MHFEEFQHLARLSIVGALDPDELAQFQAGRREFGAAAEAFLDECRKLNAVFALSLRPCAPDPRTKARLLARIQGDTVGRGNKSWLRPHRIDLATGRLEPNPSAW